MAEMMGPNPSGEAPPFPTEIPNGGGNESILGPTATPTAAEDNIYEKFVIEDWSYNLGEETIPPKTVLGESNGWTIYEQYGHVYAEDQNDPYTYVAYGSYTEDFDIYGIILPSDGDYTRYVKARYFDGQEPTRYSLPIGDFKNNFDD
jgi:hypothetical protein